MLAMEGSLALTIVGTVLAIATALVAAVVWFTRRPAKIVSELRQAVEDCLAFFDEIRDKGGVSPNDDMKALYRRLDRLSNRIIDLKLRQACFRLISDLSTCLHALWTGDREPHRSTVSNQAYAAGAAAKEARSMLDRMATLERRAL
ncbi:MAG: hypothetical protein CYG61_09550 [Actinobacteria bacterium]|nr:MAG: hypothetical protein CYG61_09550 [Actinomycetota bacterium]